MRKGVLLALALLFATEAHADLARRCCRELGLGCPSPIPTFSPSPTPTPPTDGCRTMTAEPKEFNGLWTGERGIQPSADREDCWIFKIPKVSRPYLDINTQNTSNTSCGSWTMRVVSPSGVGSAPSWGSQPGIPPKSEAGTWRLLIRTLSPCDPYGLIVRVGY